MSTKYIASNWRLLNQENSSKSDNYGLTFDGSSEYIDCGALSQIGSSSSFTINLWAKSDASTGSFTLLGIRQSTTDRILVLNAGSANKLWFAIQNGINDYIETTHSLSTTEWEMITLTYDGSLSAGSRASVYINGSSISVTQPNLPTSVSANMGTSSLYIGYQQGTSGYYDGKLSEVAVFDYALSSTQISTLYGSSELGSTSPMALKPQPVGYWPLGDNSASNPLTQPNEAVEDASVFDFSSSFIDCGDSDDFSFTDGSNDLSYSFSAWVNADTLSTDLNQPNTIISKYGTSTNEWWFLIENKKLVIINYDQSNPTIIGRKYNTDLSANTWYHVAATYDGSKNVTGFKLYLDGVRVDDTNYNANTTYGGMQNQVQNVFIGKRDRATRLSYFDGQINNTQIWQAELSASEIETLYNSGVPLLTGTQPQASSLRAWYKLDQSANWDVSGSGNWTIPDASGNGNDGTSSGMTSANLVLSDLTRAVPYDSYSFNFDSASSDYIDASLTSDVYACSLWFKPNTAISSGSTLQYLINFGGAWNGINLGEMTGSLTGEVIIVTDASVTGRSAYTGGTISADWHHLCVNWSGSVYEIWLDGVNVQNATTGTPQLISATDLQIGRRSTSPEYYFDGKISNISIFNEGLTSTEVLKLYSNGVPQDLTNFTPQPVAFYTLGSNSFFNGSNWICRDLIGSNDGTSANAGADAIVGDAPRSEANGVGTNNSIPENLVGTTKWSELNSWSINMSSEARVQDTP